MWTRILGVIAGCYLAVACGKTIDNPQPESAAGAGSGSGGSAGSGVSGGSAGAVGVGGSVEVGGSQSVGASQSVGGVSGASAGAGPMGGGGYPNLSHEPPLITGDEACPSEAPIAEDCTEEGAACVYAGYTSNGISTKSPMACTCTNRRWSCVSSDEKGDTACPRQEPLGKDFPGPCPAKAALPCWYVRFAPNLVLAGCYCNEVVEGAGGAGGEGGVTSYWPFCGL